MTRLSRLLGVPLLLLANQCVSSDGDPSDDAKESSAGGSDPSDGGVGGSQAAGGQKQGSGGASVDCVVDLECSPAPLPSTGDFGQDCVDRINQFRVECSCLPPLTRWVEAEACAEANAVYDQGTGEAHSGWRGPACDADAGPLSTDMNGWATNECPGPYYKTPEAILGACLSAMYGEGARWAESLGREPTQADLKDCEGSCYSENGHFIAMTKESHSLVACGITPNGEIWSVQNFK